MHDAPRPPLCGFVINVVGVIVLGFVLCFGALKNLSILVPTLGCDDVDERIYTRQEGLA